MPNSDTHTHTVNYRIAYTKWYGNSNSNAEHDGVTHAVTNSNLPTM